MKPSQLRISASLALAVALIASFASGAHRSMPSRKVKTVGVFPGVTSKAIARGCAAWGEDVASCVSARGESITDYAWPERGNVGMTGR